MLKIKVTNSKNQTLQITQNASYQLVSIKGINPTVANISTTELATTDGAEFNVARAQKRNIVLTIQPLGDVEQKRQALYPYFSPKSKISLEVITSNRDVVVDGYVESFEVDYNANPELFQISIICPSAYLKAKTPVSVSGTTFPLAVNNPSEIRQGAVFTVTFNGNASYLSITNNTNGESLSLTGSFVSGDVIRIDTIAGEKEIKNTRTQQSVIAGLNLSSKWVQLEGGTNGISVSASNLSAFNVAFTPLYMGV